MFKQVGVVFGVTLLFHPLAFGLGTESFGPDQPVYNQPGWPKGIVDAASHHSRVYWRWVNGGEGFYFKASTEQINELLELYSKCRLRDHEVSIRLGTGKARSFHSKEIEYNVSLEVLTGISLFMKRREDPASTHEPTLTIYVDQFDTVKKLRTPGNLTVHYYLEDAKVKTPLKPERKAWWGRVEVSGSTPGARMEQGVSTRISFWEKEIPDGIEVAAADRDGFFAVALSDAELQQLRKGTSWLTITIGDYAAVPASDDPKLTADSLSQERAKAEPVSVRSPK